MLSMRTYLIFLLEFIVPRNQYVGTTYKCVLLSLGELRFIALKCLEDY